MGGAVPCKNQSYLNAEPHAGGCLYFLWKDASLALLSDEERQAGLHVAAGYLPAHMESQLLFDKEKQKEEDGENAANE